MADLRRDSKSLFSRLKLNNERTLRDSSYFDRTDTVSIASIQSSIFDLDSSLASHTIENFKNDQQDKVLKHPYKVRPFKFKDKVPENWLYTNPKERLVENKIAENPIEWMRTVFDENNIIPQYCKSNLKYTLSKSQANLSSVNNMDFPDEVDAPPLLSYKSVSDLKFFEEVDNLNNDDDDEQEDQEYHMIVSKTAPGSVENIAEMRSSFQEFVALAKLQEEKLKAEVLKRKSEFNSSRSSMQIRHIPSVKFIKNSRKSVPINRFGFQDFNPVSNQPRIATTRYSKQNSINPNKSDVNTALNSKFSLQPSDTYKRPSERIRNHNSENLRRSVDYKPTLKLYHV